TLLVKINEFSQARRQWLEAKKLCAKESCDLETLKERAIELRDNFMQQKKDWLMLNARIA
ncbi:MAG: hypothetical protein L3J69_02455, partial [Desulfobacula sp.]|nr:hypothetical protein [Desulfobacula sp.]